MRNYIYNKKNKNVLFHIIFIIALLIFLLSFMSLTFKEDEEVTMGFMEHGFYSIINIDSLDVHPPLYYLLLKVFLMIFTFWTKSFFIKTIFARLFSLICFILVFYFLICIIKLSKIHLNKKIIFISFLLLSLMPSVMEVATHIRMYELATLFIVIEYYKLIEFDKSNKNVYLIFATVFAILAAYTHYFIAIIAVLLLIIYCIKELKMKCINKFFAIIISGISFGIFYIPMVPYVFTQFINRSHFPQSSNNIYDPTISSLVQLTAANNKIKDLFDLILFLTLIIFTSTLIKFSHEKFIVNRIHEIGLCVIIVTIIEFIISIMYSKFYECRFIFPLVSIYFFLLIILFIIDIKRYGIRMFKFIKKLSIISFLICILFIGLSDFNKFNQNVKQYDIPSVTLVNNLDMYKTLTNKNINVTLKKPYPTPYQEALYATQNAVYLKSINKNAIVYHPNDTNFYSECNDNRKFVNKLFTNLYVK